MSIKITDQELADARLMLALEILDAPNAADIVSAIQHLMIAQAVRAAQERKKGNKRRAKQWKRASDELFTVMMCAVYQNEDRKND